MKITANNSDTPAFKDAGKERGKNAMIISLRNPSRYPKAGPTTIQYRNAEPLRRYLCH
jgi:hypothetical protein